MLLVAASIFTLASMLKIWRFAFQRVPGGAPDEPARWTGSGSLVAMLALILGLGFAAGPAQQHCLSTAQALLGTSAYAEAMSSAPGRPLLLDEEP
jgi:formate hydrogenlyase subunit 3/multisubunit Na+/H+ antiporter MnhD subunit